MKERTRLTTYLVYRLGKGPEQVVLWDTLDITVGRLETRDIVIPDAEVSREHAVFRKSGDTFTVEDLGSVLGTEVNGERISRHQLTPGDMIRIGALALKFDQTTRSIRPGGNVRFASQLKNVGFDTNDGGGTMLGVELDDDIAPTLPPQPVARARAVSADGSLEEISEIEPLATEDFDPLPSVPQAPRNLDLELASDLFGPDTEAGDTIARLELEVKGPDSTLKAVVSALQGKCIKIPPFTIRLRERQRS
jgi:predicted component of type VI protein secretion system